MKRTSEQERGANLVEFAIVVPIIILVVIGILEVGVAFRDLLTVSNAAKEGVRIVAAMGDDPMADCVAITKTASAVASSVPLANLIDIAIFRADEDGNQTGDTNTYRLRGGGDPAECGDWTPDPTRDPTHPSWDWSPLDRQVVFGLDPSDPEYRPLDIVGVRVRYTHNWITGFPPFTGSFVIDEATVSRIEPEEYLR